MFAYVKFSRPLLLLFFFSYLDRVVKFFWTQTLISSFSAIGDSQSTCTNNSPSFFPQPDCLLRLVLLRKSFNRATQSSVHHVMNSVPEAELKSYICCQIWLFCAILWYWIYWVQRFYFPSMLSSFFLKVFCGFRRRKCCSLFSVDKFYINASLWQAQT